MLALLINNRGGDAALWEGRSSRQGSSWMLLVRCVCLTASILPKCKRSKDGYFF
jgi:hypothetical protein